MVLQLLWSCSLYMKAQRKKWRTTNSFSTSEMLHFSLVKHLTLSTVKLLTKLAFFIFLLIQFLEGAATSMSYLKVSKSRTSTNGDFQKSICWIKCHHMTRNQCGSWVFFWLVFQVKVLTEANRYALSVWYPFPFFKMKFKWMLVIKHLLTSDFRIDRKKNIQSCQIFFCFLLKEEDTIFHSSFHSKE